MTNRIIKVEKISFSSRLKELMKEQGISQAKLAEMLGVSKNTVSSWISKDVPVRYYKKERLAEIGKIFDVDPEYLDCSQVERRRQAVDFSTPELNERARMIGRELLVIKMLDELQVVHDSIPSDRNVETCEYVDNGFVYEVEVPSDCDIELTNKEGKSVFISEDEFLQLCNKVFNFLMYLVNEKFREA